MSAQRRPEKARPRAEDRRRGRAARREQWFGIVLDRALSNSASGLLFAADSAALPLRGSCVLAVDPSRLLLALTAPTDASGGATMPLPMPNDLPLQGLLLFAQHLVFDPNGAGLATFAATQGLLVVIAVD
jgi:hypothetical protein